MTVRTLLAVLVLLPPALPPAEGVGALVVHFAVAAPPSAQGYARAFNRTIANATQLLQVGGGREGEKDWLGTGMRYNVEASQHN